MKKVIIVGGGIAGLSAGVYLQQAGLQTEIYEKNAVAGGQCMGWTRDGYFIDNCIHWLTGTKKGTALNDLWRNLGALGDNIEEIELDKFYSASLNGETITFWRDLERTRKELKELSPEDKDEIDRLIDNVKLSESMQVPVEKPFDMMTMFDYMKMGMSMADMSKVLKEYGKIDIDAMSAKFKHPLIRLALNDYMPPHYQAYAFLVSYATMTSGNGKVPRGGSLQMVMRIIERYKSLGGKLFTNAEVDKILVNRNKADGICLKNGQKIDADYIICTCDTDFTFHKLLDIKYMPSTLKKMYDARKKYPVVSGFQAAFAVDGVFPECIGTNMTDCKPFKVGKSLVTRISYRSYAFEPSFAPEGKSVIQSNLVQTEEDYTYWMEKYKDKEAYKAEKEQLAHEMMSRIEEAAPQLKGKLRLLDVWTPATYERYCHSYHGAYMSFIITVGAKNVRLSSKIKGLNNVFLGSQWQMGPGGLPTAATMGKFAAQRIRKLEGMDIHC